MRHRPDPRPGTVQLVRNTTHLRRLIIVILQYLHISGIVAGMNTTEHQTHSHTEHTHGPDCGHEAVQHGDHVDYLHDGHRHAAHGDHYDEH